MGGPRDDSVTVPAASGGLVRAYVFDCESMICFEAVE